MDDFDRFCVLAHNEPPPPAVSHPGASELIPPALSRNRASSLREPRRRARDHSQRNPSHQGSMEFQSTLAPPDMPTFVGQGGVPGHSPFSDRRFSAHPVGLADYRRRGSSPSPRYQAYSHNTSPSRYPYNTSGGHDEFHPQHHRNSQAPCAGVVRVRSFKRTKAGLINRGDRDRVVTSENSRNSAEMSPQRQHPWSKCPADEVEIRSGHANSQYNGETECKSPHSVSPPLMRAKMRVQVIGAEQVGKTLMCSQFRQSEAVDEYAETDDAESDGNIVTVEIDKVETNLWFLDTTVNCERDIETSVIDTADAYVVVYSIDDKVSFDLAKLLMDAILGVAKRSSGLVLVANKNDLVRAREVLPEDGRNLAEVYGCPFFEVSISLNHKVNELLVGLISAIEDGQKRVEREKDRLAGRMASLSMGSGESRRGSILNQIQLIKHTHGNPVSKFFKKHFNKT